MPLYRYKAARPTGEVLEGQVEAPSAEAVMRRLQAEGNIPIRAEPLPGPRRVRTRGAALGRIGEREVHAFTLELATLLEAGLSLDRALGLLARITETPAPRALIERVNAAVRRGESLSEALAAEGPFSPLYVNLVRAGEAGGALGPTLARLAEYLDSARELRESVLSALLYPVILVLLALASVVLMLSVVVPRFATLFEDAGAQLPLATQVVVAIGAFFQSYWWAVAAGAAAVFVLLRAQLAQPETRLRCDRWLLGVPLVGSLIARVETARFARTMATLLGNGVTLPTALGIAGEIIGNRAMVAGVARITESVREGSSLAAAMLQADTFPALTAHMLEVGEETGEVQTMLARLAKIYDDEVRRALQRLVVVAEPVLIVGIGLLVGGIIFSIMVAVLSVNEITL